MKSNATGFRSVPKREEREADIFKLGNSPLPLVSLPTCVLIRFLDSLGVSATSFVLSTKQSAEDDYLFYSFSNLESFDKCVFNLFSAADFT